MSEYDYIIVGAGSAGCVMANRLSADPSKRVCLIEAGPKDRNPFIHMPTGLAVLALTGQVNWNYATEPEAELNGRRLYWPRGKVLGGSSSINAMVYIRGQAEDYDGWARLAGPDWGWDRVKPLFIDLEGNAALGGPHHGRTGPLSVSNLRSVNPLSRAFVEAGEACQHRSNDDFNGARQEGVGIYQVTHKEGQRFSSARAFLDPVRGRENLTVLTGALVEKVTFKAGRASGVQLRDRALRLAEGGEVILSGGAINSPQLLMLSGIGPGAELQRFGIEVLADRADVGGNLADHLDMSVLASIHGKEGIAVRPSFLPRALKGAWKYAMQGQGELTSNVAEAGGFIRSHPDRERPNLQFHFLPGQLRDHGRKLATQYGVTIHVCDLLPKSRGRIGLKSADPQAHARIEANYLSHPEDMDVVLAGLKAARNILAAPPLAQHIKAELLPGPDVQSDEALIEDIRARAETIYHPVGTCRMGTDAEAVVDPQGRVNGVAGLRVVDASIMPTIIAGNTNAPTMMLAENIARMMGA